MTPENPSWAAREPDETLHDWLLRLQISHAAVDHHHCQAPRLENTA